MIKIIRFLFFGLIANTAIAQTPIFQIPEEASLDSVFTTIFNLYEYDEQQIKRIREFGWCSYSDKIDTDSFFQASKQYCIDLVGKEYFHDNFRLIFHSFKDNRFSNVYTILFRFYPPGLGDEEFVKIIFKNFSFLNFKQESSPLNLPNCFQDPSSCSFPINREKLEEIVNKELNKGEDKKFSIIELTADYQWYCRLFTNGWPKNFFYVDARTGQITGLEAD